MTERAMPEGELRDQLVQAAFDACCTDKRWFITPKERGLTLEQWNADRKEIMGQAVDAVLAVLRPHLGLGVTDEEKGLVVDAVDAWADRYGGERLNRLRDSIRVKMGYPTIAERSR